MIEIIENNIKIRNGAVTHQYFPFTSKVLPKKHFLIPMKTASYLNDHFYIKICQKLTILLCQKAMLKISISPNKKIKATMVN